MGGRGRGEGGEKEIGLSKRWAIVDRISYKPIMVVVSSLTVLVSRGLVAVAGENINKKRMVEIAFLLAQRLFSSTHLH
ncbi:uncharacterized protein BO97DRAFT_32681 [Aspergillus homomorphus CBS 101889]|uniref:Uncharacterized protein n=1 Tax=Aspergillus homomorphus (strain CBS 101889) TaxID=1450537 RepID=A0A395I1B5_ASPHC|nr:hypothetical protein BO97DRAFT_32681 [Aspergillus homomorphus CBS 101889]RAL13596.1 hypothetical protein BO97DRAFT_32681 [Aspergillus homomorphus CBS 101889]